MAGAGNDQSPTSAFNRFGPKTHAMMMLRRYNPSIGAAKIVCVIRSPLGVMTAATMKMIRSAYLKF